MKERGKEGQTWEAGGAMTALPFATLEASGHSGFHRRFSRGI